MPSASCILPRTPRYRFQPAPDMTSIAGAVQPSSRNSKLSLSRDIEAKRRSANHDGSPGSKFSSRYHRVERGCCLRACVRQLPPVRLAPVYCKATLLQGIFQEREIEPIWEVVAYQNPSRAHDGAILGIYENQHRPTSLFPKSTMPPLTRTIYRIYDRCNKGNEMTLGLRGKMGAA